MYIKNKMFSLIFKIIMVLIGGYGLILNSGILEGNLNLSVFTFYTIISNILVFGYFIYYIIKYFILKKPIPEHSTIKGMVTIGITLTLVIYHFLLMPSSFEMGGHDAVLSAANLTVHYIVPIMAILDWVLFDKKGTIKKMDPLIWTLLPLGYFIFAIIRAQIGPDYWNGTRYPYFFIDIDKLGLGQVMLNVVIISVIYIAFCYLVYGLDYLLGKKAKQKK